MVTVQQMDDRSIVLGPCSGKDDKVVYIQIATIASPNEGTSAGYKI